MDSKTHHHNCTTDLGRGCTFCHCQEGEQTARACEGCYKLHTYDWLEQLPLLAEAPDDIFEVRFKNTRKGFYRNATGAELRRGDVVVVEASPGHDVGIVSLTGEMVARQMRRTGFRPENGEYKKVLRKALSGDIQRWQEAIALEHETMILSRQIAADMNLDMKIGDVEYQGDRLKAIFYYIADARVDFRELIKVFAERFHIRVEMRQIGARQEAGRIGGLGNCGRELCCASWISGFVSVTTSAARHQELSLNPLKLAGQCGKLKCCLVYELDAYMEAKREMPRVHNPLQALDGEYFLVKSDLLARTMTFASSPHEMANAVTLPIERVKEILEVNRRGEKVERIQDFELQAPAPAEEPDYMNVVGEDSITRFDRSGGNRGRGGRSRGGRRNGERRSENAERKQQAAAGPRQGGEPRPQGENRHRSRGGRNRGRGRNGNGGNGNGGNGGNGGGPKPNE